MEFPPEITAIIKEFSMPLTHSDWREGSWSAAAVRDSLEWYNYQDVIEGELGHDADNWSWYRWCYHKHILKHTPASSAAQKDLDSVLWEYGRRWLGGGRLRGWGH